ncbi:MAG TPA: c-type cytochrome [Chitinophagaceae bacterium]
MKYKTHYFFIICFCYILCEGCEKKKEVLAYPQSTCDTLSVKYSLQVVTVLNTNCYSCHSSANANTSGGGVKLDTYPDVNPWAANGSLLNNIMHTQGYDPMPKNTAKLSDCDIAKIRIWVTNGYPDN